MDGVDSIFTDIIATFISQKRAFTAYEVFLESKSSLNTTKYFEVKKYIHQNQKLNDELNFGVYIKTLIPINQKKAWLYHDQNYDVSQYTHLLLDNNCFVTTPSELKNISDLKPGDTVVTSNGNCKITSGYNLNYRNQLFVYTKFLKEINAKPFDSIALVPNPINKRLYITLDLDTGKIQKVERNGDIRISYTNLSLANLTKKHLFQFEVVEYKNKPAIEVYNIDFNGTKI